MRLQRATGRCTRSSCSTGRIAETLPRLAAAYDEPLGDEAAFPTFLIAEQARRHVTVALAGDGGDEAFAGYERYIAHGLADRVPCGGAAPARPPCACYPARAASRARAVSGRHGFLDVAATPPRRPLRAADGGLPAGAPAGALDYDARESAPRTRRSSRPPSRRGSRASSSSTSSRISPATSSKGGHRLDGALARAALALPRPRVVELGLALPDHLKVRGREGKVALRRAFAPTSPAEVATRGKTGFGVPLGRWFREELRELARDAARRPTAAGSGRDAVERLLDEHERGRADHGHRLWCLLMLELWLREHVEARRSWSPLEARSPDPARRGRGVAAAPRRPRSTSGTTILSAFTEKSDDFAVTFVDHGHLRLRTGPAVRVHAAALRLLPRPDLLDLRPHLVVGRARADRRSRSRGAARLRDRPARAVRPRGRVRGGRRDAEPVPRLARRPRQPGDPRPASRAPRSCCASLLARRAPLARAAVARALRRPRDPRQRAAVLLPLVARASSCSRRSGGGLGAGGALLVGCAVAVAPWVVRNNVRSAASRSRPTGARSGRRTTRSTYAHCSRTATGSTTSSRPAGPPVPEPRGGDALIYDAAAADAPRRRVRADALLPAQVRRVLA